MSNPDRQSLIDRLFLQTVDLPADERRKLLDAQCGADDKLRIELDSLLEADALANTGFIAQGAVNVHGAMALPSHDRNGEQIGPYVLQERIASGGFGVVYHASRRSPYEEQVAIKLLHPDRLQSAEIVRRTFLEMQALSDLRHKYIVRQLQSGTSEKGEPYIVMEFVAGLPLLQFCNERRLGIPERLQLFQRVCEAVQFVHDHGWIHRDLKPANVLVDDYGVPKLLDFGIARMVRAESEQATPTLTRSPLGTPQYMSPEQLSGDVGPTSDIFGLGVMLCELLAGHRAFDAVHATPAYSMEQVREALQTSSPRLPSDFIHGVSEAEVADPVKVAHMRNAGPLGLARCLRGDLDNIVLTALRFEPERRYACPALLSNDIQAWLEHRPVSARPESARYLASKWCRRNGRVAMAFGVLLLFALVAAVTSVQNRASQKNNQLLKLDRVVAQHVVNDDIAEAVGAIHQAFVECPDGSRRDSYLRQLQSWHQYLGYPLSEYGCPLNAFSYDGKMLCCVAPTGQIQIWDLVKQRIVDTFQIPVMPTQVGFSRDDRRLLFTLEVAPDRSEFQIRTLAGGLLMQSALRGDAVAIAEDTGGCWRVLSVRQLQEDPVFRQELCLTSISPNFEVDSVRCPLAIGQMVAPNHSPEILLNRDLVLVPVTDPFSAAGPNLKLELRTLGLREVQEIPVNQFDVNGYFVDEKELVVACLGSKKSKLFEIESQEVTSIEGRLVWYDADSGSKIVKRKGAAGAFKLIEINAGGQESELLELMSDARFSVFQHTAGFAFKSVNYALTSEDVGSRVARLEYVGDGVVERSARDLQHPQRRFAQHAEYDRMQLGRFGNQILWSRPRWTHLANSKPSLPPTTTAWVWQFEPFLCQPTTSCGGELLDITASEDGSWVACICSDGVRLWASGSGDWTTLSLNSEMVSAIAVRRNPPRVVVGDQAGRLHVWGAVATGQLTRPEFEHVDAVIAGSGSVKSVEYSEDGNRLLVTTLSCVKLLDAVDLGANHRQVESVAGAFSSARFSGGRPTLLSGSSLHRFRRPHERFQSSGAVLAFTEFEGDLRWVAKSRRKLQLESASSETIPLFTPDWDSVVAEFSPQGDVFVLGFNDGTIQFRDTFSGAPLSMKCISGRGPVTHIAFSGDGKRCFSVCATGELRMWRNAAAEPPQQWLEFGEDLIQVLCVGSVVEDGVRRKVPYEAWKQRYSRLVEAGVFDAAQRPD